MARFFVEDLPAAGQVQLSPEEAKHAASVLRVQAGDSIELFDGKGGEAQGVVTTVSKKSVTLDILQRTDALRELDFHFVAYVSLPKGDRQKLLVDGLTQLGVSKLVPLQAERSVAQPTDNALQRLKRTILESSKQCRRNHLMEIAAPVRTTELSSRHAGDDKLFAHPYGECESLTEISIERPTLAVAIGPEGGFTEEETLQLRQNAWRQISLGPRILRIEMAALAIAAILSNGR